MSSENRGNYPNQPPPIYTVYPGGYQDQPNYGFHPPPPPPRYEDVVKGTTTAQPQYGNEGPQPGGVLLVSPVYTYSNKLMMFRLFCIILFIIFFLTIVIRFSIRTQY